MRLPICRCIGLGMMLCGSIWLACVSTQPAQAEVVYWDSRPGRQVLVRIPSQSTTTIHKTVRIYAPPGSTVIYGEMPLDDEVEVPSYVQTTTPLPVMPSLRTAQQQCLTVGAAAGRDVAAAYVAPCISAERAQRVQLRQGRVTINGWCLQAQGETMVAASCSGTNEQDWRLQQHRIVQPGSGRCVTVSTLGQMSGLRAQPCDASTAQYFD